jgi:hypothetical protein
LFSLDGFNMTNLTNVSTTWLDAAEDRAEGMHNPKLWIGAGLGGGLILGSLLNPLTGFATILYGLYMAWDANEKNSDQIEAVEDGIIAHVLNKKQLRQYRIDAGDDKVRFELNQAIERELKLSNDAHTLAKEWGITRQMNARAAAPMQLLGQADHDEMEASGESLTPPQDGENVENCQPALTQSNPSDDRESTISVEAVTSSDDDSVTDSDENQTCRDDVSTVTGSYGLDKLRGVSLKQFKEMLRAQGVTHENGSFRSVEATELPSSEQFVRKRLEAFWKEWNSRKVNHAIWFVFGIQNGGGRSTEATDRFKKAKQYVEDWFSIYVDREDDEAIF